jgi:hypothetical protein
MRMVDSRLDLPPYGKVYHPLGDVVSVAEAVELGHRLARLFAVTRTAGQGAAA